MEILRNKHTFWYLIGDINFETGQQKKKNSYEFLMAKTKKNPEIIFPFI